MRFASSASLFTFAMLGLTLVVAPACSSSSSSSAAPITGVNDALRACEIRAAWKGTSSTPCNNCIGLATTPRCACTDQEYAGKCSDQTAAKTKEPTCDGVADCISKCAHTDCACADACYAGKATCRTLASAADGCVAEVCDTYCR